MTSPDWHVDDAVLRAYAHGLDLAPAVEWSLDAHLLACPDCRARVADHVLASDGAAAMAVAGVADALDERLPHTAQLARPRRRLPQQAGRVASWAIASIVALAAAAIADALAGEPGSFVLLVVAPVVPVLGVALAWGRVLDPLHEVAVSASRAGLSLVLQRTLAVLVLVIPLAVLAGLLTGGASAAAWLLPCLALTVLTLALGGALPITLAAASVVAAWTAAIALPALLRDVSPAALEPRWMPAWALLAILAAAALLARRDRYRRLEIA